MRPVNNPYISALDALDARLARPVPLKRLGRLVESAGTVVRANMPSTQIGELCELRSPGPPAVTLGLAEVIGFEGGQAILSPFDSLEGVSPDTEVVPLGCTHTVAVGEGLLGGIIDGMGRPIGEQPDRGGLIPQAVMRAAPNPMDRPPIEKAFSSGISAIDGFTTLGVGQRVGIFSAAGVGKSSLMGMLARNADVDVTVLALIGERGREVREFLERTLPPEARSRTVAIVATADQPALQRVRAAHVATTVAEYFRAQGKHVLLLMDSVTRFARALREIGLAAGESPTRRGFPSSVFAELPRLVERAGLTSTGAITAIYTVLVEGDDMSEPVADEMRSLLDGHLILSRELAAANHFPALDVLESRSRLMDAICSRDHVALAGRLRRLASAYKDVELLIKMGEYREGSDKESDQAIAVRDPLARLLRQLPESRVGLAHTVASMRALLLHG